MFSSPAASRPSGSRAVEKRSGSKRSGRPYPLFRDLFRHAATTHNPFYGAAAFVLQSVGNIVVMSLLFLTVTASAFVIAGVFTLVYWELKVLGRVGYLWFPIAPWNN
jgi:hypothetical protein